MEASGRRKVVAALGLAAVTAGGGLIFGSWRLASRFNPAAIFQPPSRDPVASLVDLGARVQSCRDAGLFLVGFGLIAVLMAMHHWLWDGESGERAGEVGRASAYPKNPRFVDSE